MAEDKETVTLEDLVYAEMIQSEAIVRLLVAKGIITKEEFMEEVKAVNSEQTMGQAHPQAAVS
ncbi:hypothetical protein ACFL45_11845 [Candidatus Neomarinimicrobiota bacterium]